MTVDLPAAVTPAAAATGIWVAVGSGRVATGVVPGLVAAVAAVAADSLWRRRGKRWHDAPVILALLPALAAGVWTGVGGTLLHVHRSEAGLLLLEILPGLALTGFATTLVSYHGRHRPEGVTPERV